MISNRFVLLCFAFLVAAQAQWQKFFVVVFDDAGYNSILSSSEWKSIMEDSFITANYYGLSYPALPNLVAHLGANFENCTAESCDLAQDSVIDLLEARNLTWKAYIENYVPLDENGTCNLNGSVCFSPFQNFPSITNNTNRCARIANETTFSWDLKTDNFANFSYYRPKPANMSVSDSASYFKNWLQNWYYPHTSTAFNNTLLMVTWSQDNKTADNQVIAFFKSPQLGKGASETKYSHYSVAKFVMENFQLGSLNTTSEALNTSKNFGYELKPQAYTPPQNNSDTPAKNPPKKGPVSKSPPPPPSHGGNKKSTIALAIAIPAVLLAVAFGIWAFRKRKVTENANNTKRFGPTTNSRLIEARQDREMTSAFYLGE